MLYVGSKVRNSAEKRSIYGVDEEDLACLFMSTVKHHSTANGMSNEPPLHIETSFEVKHAAFCIQISKYLLYFRIRKLVKNLGWPPLSTGHPRRSTRCGPVRTRAESRASSHSCV